MYSCRRAMVLDQAGQGPPDWSALAARLGTGHPPSALLRLYVNELTQGARSSGTLTEGQVEGSVPAECAEAAEGMDPVDHGFDGSQPQKTVW